MRACGGLENALWLALVDLWRWKMYPSKWMIQRWLKRSWTLRMEALYMKRTMERPWPVIVPILPACESAKHYHFKPTVIPTTSLLNSDLVIPKRLIEHIAYSKTASTMFQNISKAPCLDLATGGRRNVIDAFHHQAANVVVLVSGISEVFPSRAALV